MGALGDGLKEGRFRGLLKEKKGGVMGGQVFIVLFSVLDHSWASSRIRQEVLVGILERVSLRCLNQGRGIIIINEGPAQQIPPFVRRRDLANTEPGSSTNTSWILKALVKDWPH